MEGFYFFGVEIELWKIGDSLPAPQFNVVCKPNDWQKAVKTAKQFVQSERSSMLQQMWSDIFDYMKPKFPELKYPNPSGMSWVRFQMEATHTNLSYAASKKSLYIYLLFKGDESANWFQYAKENLKLRTDFKWVERSDGSFAQWETDFDHADSEQHTEILKKVGNLLTEIQNEIKFTRENYLNQM